MWTSGYVDLSTSLIKKAATQLKWEGARRQGDPDEFGGVCICVSVYLNFCEPSPSLASHRLPTSRKGRPSETHDEVAAKST